MTPAEDPPWLSDNERELWVRLVRLTMLLPSALEAQLKRDTTLSFFEYHVLAMLSEAEGRTRLMSDLAHWSNSSLSRLSHVVARLEKQGWIRREVCPNDRRATLAVLTELGLNRLRAHAPAHVAEVRRLIFDGIAPQQVPQVSAVLGAVLDRLSPQRDDAVDETSQHCIV